MSFLYSCETRLTKQFLPFNELAQNGVSEGGLERQLLLECVHARLAQVADPLQGAAQNPAKNIQFITVLGVFASRVSLMKIHLFGF